MAAPLPPVIEFVMVRRFSTWLVGAALVGLGLGVGVVVPVRAQEGTDDDPVLHEYFDPGLVDEPDPRPGPGGDRPSAPPAETGGAGEPPELTLQAGSGDRVRGPSGPLGASEDDLPYGPSSPRGAATALDDETDRVDDLEYNSVFDPTVFPYKRGVVQNRPVRTASGTYGMKTARGDYEQLRVEGGTAADDEDLFWGSFLVRAEAGEFHPIPSVAPNQRYLDVQTEPEVAVRVYRDAADNDYVQIDHTGRVRVNVRIAAPEFYFSGRFDSAVEWEAFDVKREATALPEAIAGVAEDVAEMVEVSRRRSPDAVMEQLIYYFRNFETRSLPDELRSGDLYRTLAEQQIGVCRHRSMAFVMTAMALGIPARYVTNEAHAFVEVWWPRGGWRRVDLGGAARDIGYDGDADDRVHAAGRDDPFPKPPAYREELRELRGEDGEGTEGGEGNEEAGASTASSEDRESRRPSSGNRPPGGNEGTDSRRAEQGETPDTDAGTPIRRPQEERRAERKARRASRERREEADRTEQARRTESVEERRRSNASREQEEASQRRGTRLSIRVPTREVFRGAEVVVEGQLVSAGGAPVSRRPVTVYFGRVGASRLAAMEKIGTATTDERGRYRMKVTIPETVGVGRWSLVASFAGDDTYASARAE